MKIYKTKFDKSQNKYTMIQLNPCKYKDEYNIYELRKK